MPVKKFRTLEEAERAQGLEPGDPAIWDAARRRWALHRVFGHATVPSRRGVFRFASLDAKQRDAHRAS